MKKDSVCLITLGCSKNLVDSEKLLGKLSSLNYKFTERIEEAEICIINTCGFIKLAVEESLQTILYAIDLKEKKKIKKLIVFGCLTQRFQEEIKEQFPEVDLIVGVDSNESIMKYLNNCYDLKDNEFRYLLTPRHYAYLKISEGCNRQCSFCAIPNIRGKLKSRTIEEIVGEATQLSRLGTKELIIISQDTTSYGVDIYNRKTIAELIRTLSCVESIRWIRLQYLYPSGIPDELFDLISERPNICKYIDIPIQHISDKVLRNMQRGTSRKEIENLIDKIRAKIPNVAIRTTLIVGYPNETEKDFRELTRFVESTKFDRLGVFTYSHEDGTTAFSLEDKVPEDEKNRRKEELMLIQQEISLKKNEALLGREIEVIIDGKNDGEYIGRTQNDSPDVDCLVHIRTNKKMQVGNFAKVKVVRVEPYDIYAKF